MFKVFVLLAIFIVFVYVYSLKKMKRTREKTQNINTIQEFHDSYGHLLRKEQTEQRPYGEYQKYVTKYNSSEDYREKR